MRTEKAETIKINTVTVLGLSLIHILYEYATIRMGKEVEGMNGLKIKRTEVEEFKKYLIMEEKSKITIKKYIHDIGCFLSYIGKNPVTKERIIS